MLRMQDLALPPSLRRIDHPRLMLPDLFRPILSKRLRRRVALLRRSRLFDAASYREKYGLPFWVNSGVHFCTRGWRDGFSPSRFFDTAFHLDQNPDVRTSGVNPLVHF